MDSATLVDLFGEPISSYSRAQAIEDGMLVDVSTLAREAGITFPVAMSAGSYADCVRWTRTGPKDPHQDETGRLWDVVFMLSMAIRRSKPGNRVNFALYRIPNTGRGTTAKLVNLYAVCDGGDDGEPVITIMLPTED
jgi:hypothetical protein